MTWPFGNLTPLSYHVILIDPPWHYKMWSQKGEAKAPQAHYDTMSIEELMALPVGELAAADCLLCCWSTWPHLPDALELVKAWGFHFKTGGAWLKGSKNGKQKFGPGYVVRSGCEPYLLATIGRPLLDRRSRGENSGIFAEAREHSRKPDEMRLMLERLMPDARKCELFARSAPEGWECWGNEVGKFAAN